jgi:hypothetical protein
MNGSDQTINGDSGGCVGSGEGLKQKRARIEIQPVFKIQYPMKNQVPKRKRWSIVVLRLKYSGQPLFWSYFEHDLFYFGNSVPQLWTQKSSKFLDLILNQG